jgi:hypothetical protein
MDKTTIGIIVIAIAVFGGIIGSAAYSNKNFQPRNMCVEHSNALSMHIHPIVRIKIDGQPTAIPANIGIDPTCMKAVHTHDDTGTVHLEYPEKHDFTLGDFFAVWGQNFSKTQILDKNVDDTHTLTVTVDGQPNEDYEKLILNDKQQIEINYTTKQ